MYYARNDKACNHCHVLAMILLLAEATDCLICAVHVAPLPLGLKNHQSHVSTVVELVTGHKHDLILILVP